MKMFSDNNPDHDDTVKNAKLKERVQELIDLCSKLKRGCDCDYDYRCSNCNNILKVINLADELKGL